ncbi:MAG: HPF/RaiA family ribosome-associated protein [Patescibacteria group bacterium]|nr:HPF/RaiA family ribosome-associated protein [Patescibacteria group bacterium]
MKIIYYLKNLKPSRGIFDFIKRKSEKLDKTLEEHSDILMEVDLSKSKEIKSKEGPYRIKLIIDISRRSLFIAKGAGKNLIEAINLAFKKLFRQLRQKH